MKFSPWLEWCSIYIEVPKNVGCILDIYGYHKCSVSFHYCIRCLHKSVKLSMKVIPVIYFKNFCLFLCPIYFIYIFILLHNHLQWIWLITYFYIKVWVFLVYNFKKCIIISITVQICEIGAPVSRKPSKINENQMFLAIPGDYLTLSQIVDINQCSSTERLCQVCFVSFLQMSHGGEF